VTVRERDRGGFGSSLLSPTLSNWGVFIYIAIFLVLLVVVVLVVVFRRRIRKEEAAVNRGEGTLKPDMEEVDAPVRTDEEKRREYQKLYGSASAGADTGKIRTGSTHHEENPFLVAGTDGGSDKHREEEYDLVFTAKDGDEDEEGYGKGHVYEEVYEDGGGREGSGDYEGGEVDDSTGLGEKSGNMEGEVTGTGAQRKGALQKAAAEEREKIALRTEKLKKLREKRKERRRKTLEKTRVNDIFDFLNDLADDVGDGGSNGVGDGAGDKGENTADEDLSGGDMEESLPEMDWDEDEEAMEGREEEQDATDQGDGEEVNGLKGWSI